jgi:hypothetical protein
MANVPSKLDPAHVADIQNRNWTSIYDEPQPSGGPVKPSGFPEGGKVEKNVDVSDPTWTDIRRRLAILKNPLIEGKPPSLIPPLPHGMSSEDAVNHYQIQDAKSRIANLMGKQMADQSGVASETIGPMHFSSSNQDLLDMLSMKLGISPGDTKDAIMAKMSGMKAGVQKAVEETPDEETGDKTMRRGGRTARRRHA